MWNAAALASAGLLERARWETDELLTTNPGLTIERLKFAFPFSDPGTLDGVLKALRSAGLPD